MASIADLIRESTRDAKRREMTHDDSFRRGQDLMRDTATKAGQRLRKVGGAIDDTLASTAGYLLPQADMGSRYNVGYDEPVGKWEQMGDTPEAAQLKTIAALFPTGSLSDAAAGGKAVLRTFGGMMPGKVDLSKLDIGAPELKTASIGDLHDALASMRARNIGKGLDEDIATGAIRDEIARRNAVEMLGLPESNTAMDRAGAMGLDTEAYHGTGKDGLKSFRRGITWTGPKDVASEYASLRTGWEDLPGNVLPLIISAKPIQVTSPGYSRGTKFWSDLLAEAKANGSSPDMDSAKKIFNDLRSNHERTGLDNSETATHNHWNMVSDQGRNLLSDYVDALGGYDALRFIEEGTPTVGLFNPKNIRSRFAAFDPKLRDSPNLLAANPYGLSPYALTGEDDDQPLTLSELYRRRQK